MGDTESVAVEDETYARKNQTETVGLQSSRSVIKTARATRKNVLSISMIFLKNCHQLSWD